MKYILLGLLLIFNIGLNAQTTIYIWVDGTCSICKERIEKASLQLMGVQSAEWNEQTKILSLETDSNFYKDDLLTHLASVGHNTKSTLASKEEVENIEPCCSYISDHMSLKNSKESEFWVNGVCGMCKDRIEEASLEFDGIISASWNQETKMLTVESDESFNVNALYVKLASVGHDNEFAKASDEIYANMHECCKYRDEEIIEAHSPDSELEVYNWDENADHSNDFHGVIREQSKEGKKTPLIGATVSWLGTNIATTTDEQGFFTLTKQPDVEKIIVQYVGYTPDTINTGGQHIVDILLKSNYILDEVSITYKKKTTEISFLNTMKIRQINQKELLKAACCSLSESFETTPSVDVSFTDAVTGTRKIELLGLAGPNVQIMRENIPYIRGLAALNGLSLTPGPWVESMQLNIGSGSVLNGPEALTGQINVEIKKPKESERLYIGLYGNQWQRFELNANTTTKVSDQLNTAFILHASQQNAARDGNNDGFLDAPLSKQINFVNRWKLHTKNNLQSQIGIKYSYQDKTSGQLPSLDSPENLWIANQNTERIESWFKMGKVLDKNPNRSFGFIMNYAYHDQNSNFGLNTYLGTQNSFYANLIVSQLIEGTSNKLNFGVSYQHDNFQEHLSSISYLRNEIMPGIFTEYNTSSGEKWDFIFGLRADYHNNYGILVNPRVHVRYAPSEYQAWRFSAGRGLRTASIFAENIGMFVSSREIILEGETNTPYGLSQDIAWNTGLSYTQEVQINERSMVFGGEYYFTYFENNVILDYDTDVGSVYIYNSKGGTIGHSLQLHAEYEVIENLSLKAAYRFNDVRIDYKNGRQLKALTSRHRAFLNASVELPKRWNLDGTFNVQGPKRIPSTVDNPIEFQLDEYSPVFYTFNGQISKFFNNGIEAYIGVENLFNFRQIDAIVDAENPFGEYFDSSLIWGPIMGRNIYFGCRYRLF